MAASAPPAIMASASPRSMMRKASPMEWAEEAHAVAVASLGPRAPKRMETCPAARLTMDPGMKKGEILRGPPASMFDVFALDDVETADSRADMDARRGHGSTRRS
jgi:hypothetical protein